MSMLILQETLLGAQFHQKNWGLEFIQGWRRWRLRWTWHAERKLLRDLADNPHLLADIGVTREEALREANRPFFELTDTSGYSI